MNKLASEALLGRSVANFQLPYLFSLTWGDDFLETDQILATLLQSDGTNEELKLLWLYHW